MATTAVNTGLPTLLDQAKRMDPNGAIAVIAEMLTQRNPFLEDAVFVEGNNGAGHKTTARTALPAVTRRQFNQGVAPTKSKTDQVNDACTNISGMSKVDATEVGLYGNGAAFRASEDEGFMQSMNNEAEKVIVYDSSKTDATQASGIAPRFDSTTGVGGSQVILHDAAAAGADQSSMYLMGWSPQTVFCFYPQGSKAGITHKDKGEQIVKDANNLEYLALVSFWEWMFGVCVKDFRYVVRIANIDTGNLAATGNALIQTAVKAYHQLYSTKGVKLAWYCNRKVATYLHLQAMDAVKNSTLTIDNVAGKPVTHLLGIPVRETDAITNTESPVT